MWSCTDVSLCWCFLLLRADCGFSEEFILKAESMFSAKLELDPDPLDPDPESKGSSSGKHIVIPVYWHVIAADKSMHDCRIPRQ